MLVHPQTKGKGSAAGGAHEEEEDIIAVPNVYYFEWIAYERLITPPLTGIVLGLVVGKWNTWRSFSLSLISVLLQKPSLKAASHSILDRCKRFAGLASVAESQVLILGYFVFNLMAYFHCCGTRRTDTEHRRATECTLAHICNGQMNYLRWKLSLREREKYKEVKGMVRGRTGSGGLVSKSNRNGQRRRRRRSLHKWIFKTNFISFPISNRVD